MEEDQQLEEEKTSQELVADDDSFTKNEQLAQEESMIDNEQIKIDASINKLEKELAKQKTRKSVKGRRSIIH